MKLDLRNLISRLLIPRYDEITLFLMSLAFVLIFFSYAELRSGSHELFSGKRFDPRIYIALGAFVAGIIFSLYHVFTTRKKSGLEKFVMLFFAIMVNSLSGIAAGVYMLKDSQGFLMIFPILNIINGVLLFLMLRFHIIDESSIVDDDATLFQVAFGSIVVLIIFVVCRFFFEMYWAITFSICVLYATTISGIIQDFFSGPKKENIEHNQTLERMH